MDDEKTFESTTDVKVMTKQREIPEPELMNLSTEGVGLYPEGARLGQTDKVVTDNLNQKDFKIVASCNRRKNR